MSLDTMDIMKIRKQSLDEIARSQTGMFKNHHVFRNWDDFKRYANINSKASLIEGCVSVTLRNVEESLRREGKL
jgi:hypothetical protein